VVLQWGRSLARTERASALSFWPSGRSCFNGAVLLRERKEFSRQRLSNLGDASMGPFSCENGKAILRRPEDVRRGASMGPFSCENGKLVVGPSLYVTAQLQWGRSLARTERRWSNDGGMTFGTASMGPFSCENGKSGGCWRSLLYLRPASMGPFSCENGKATGYAGADAGKKLQWGRSLARTERGAKHSAGEFD